MKGPVDAKPVVRCDVRMQVVFHGCKRREKFGISQNKLMDFDDAILMNTKSDSSLIL